jgi:hypothetical protein
MQCQTVTYKFHAAQQMFARRITEPEIEIVVATGEIIANYPDDKPYPSVLLHKFVDTRPLHAVVARDNEGNCYVATAYQPNPVLWETDFKTKRKP